MKSGKKPGLHLLHKYFENVLIKKIKLWKQIMNTN